MNATTRFKRIVCRWSGCIPPFIHGHYGDECERCGQFCESENTLGAMSKFRFWWHYHRPKWMRPLDYFRKCRFCGKRFGRHTQPCDDIPF